MVKTTIPFLEKIGTVEIPAQAWFITKEKFVAGTTKNAEVKIFGIGPNFKELFLPKNEGPVAAVGLRYAKLTNYEPDGPILAELGDKKETTLSQIYVLMGRQPNGGEGVLLTDGGPNIFYVIDSKGELHAVDVGWSGYGLGDDGWNVSAVLGNDVHRYRGGRVFSPNS